MSNPILHFFRFYTLLFGLVVFFISCTKETCHDPDADNFDPADGKACSDCCVYQDGLDSVNFKIDFHHYVRNELFEFGRTYFLQDNRIVQFDYSRFYIADLSLVSNSGDTVKTRQEIFLIDPENFSINLGRMPVKYYTELIFKIGVPERLNHISPSEYPQSHPLGYQSPTMHWETEPGYIFFKLQGRIDSSIPPNAIYDADLIYHVGTNVNCKQLSLPINVQSLPHTALHVHVKLDYNELFNDISLRDSPVTMTLASKKDSVVAAQFANNFKNAFQLKSFE